MSRSTTDDHDGSIPDCLRAQPLHTLDWAVDEVHYHDAADELRYRLLKPVIDETYDPTDGISRRPCPTPPSPRSPYKTL